MKRRISYRIIILSASLILAGTMTPTLHGGESGFTDVSQAEQKGAEVMRESKWEVAREITVTHGDNVETRYVPLTKTYDPKSPDYKFRRR